MGLVGELDREAEDAQVLRGARREARAVAAFLQRREARAAAASGGNGMTVLETSG